MQPKWRRELEAKAMGIPFDTPTRKIKIVVKPKPKFRVGEKIFVFDERMSLEPAYGPRKVVKREFWKVRNEWYYRLEGEHTKHYHSESELFYTSDILKEFQRLKRFEAKIIKAAIRE